MRRPGRSFRNPGDIPRSGPVLRRLRRGDARAVTRHPDAQRAEETVQVTGVGIRTGSPSTPTGICDLSIVGSSAINASGASPAAGWLVRDAAARGNTRSGSLTWSWAEPRQRHSDETLALDEDEVPQAATSPPRSRRSGPWTRTCWSTTWCTWPGTVPVFGDGVPVAVMVMMGASIGEWSGGLFRPAGPRVLCPGTGAPGQAAGSCLPGEPGAGTSFRPLYCPRRLRRLPGPT